MKRIRHFMVATALALSSYAVHAQSAPAIQWQNSLGGAFDETANSTQPTSDGGYIVAGFSSSNGGDVSGNHGSYDFWVVKVDGVGVLQWQKSYGGSGDDRATSIQQTSDGGYIVAGYTASSDGDVTGFQGDYDYWVVKLTSTGTLQWQKTLGGSVTDQATSIQQTSDGGFIVAGFTQSVDGDVSGQHGNSDYWVVKLSSAGGLQWQTCLGGISQDVANSVQQTNDGGYIVAGYTYSSSSGNVSANQGASDFWVVKLSSTGALQWEKTLGGTGEDQAGSIQQTTDGGYIVAGWTASDDGDISGFQGWNDYWVVKLNSTGGLQWQKTLGGTSDDQANSVQQTIDGGYIVSGCAYSLDGNVTGNNGPSDYWIVKLNSTGGLQWQKAVGGGNEDFSYSIRQTSDAGYIVAGTSYSVDKDVTGNHGSSDVWLVKLAPGCTPTSSSSNAIACDSLVWNGKTYKTTGSYNDILTNAAGCDSIATLNLIVNHSTTSDTTATVCNRFTWHDITYKASTTAVWHTTNATGCDSSRTLHLTITSVSSTTTKTDALCYGGASGSITVNPTYGTSPFTYRIGTVASYGSSNIFTALKAGKYTVSILDANGCAGITSQVTIAQPAVQAATATTTDALCNGSATGSITVTPTNGVAPYTYRFGSTGSYVASNVFTNVKGGSPRIYIQDANGCVGSVVATVLQPDKMGANTTIAYESCPMAKDGNVTVDATGGTPPYSYRFGGTGAFTSNNFFNNLKAGNYRVYVNDANGCTGFSIATVVATLSPVCPGGRGIEENKGAVVTGNWAGLSLSPNPTNTLFKLMLSSTDKAATVRVLDVNGRTLYTTKTGSQSITFGQDFAPGIYLVEIRQGNEVKILKAIKMK